MDKQFPDVEAAHDLAALPTDLQPLYRRLSDDGRVWQAASAERLASLAQSLVSDIERRADTLTLQHDSLTSSPVEEEEPAASSVASSEVYTALPVRQRRYHWIFGTVAAVMVVSLLALVLQAGLVGRGTTGPTSTNVGHWQVLDLLTVKSTSASNAVAIQAPVIAPSNPQVAFEATNSISGQGGKAVTYASLRRTEDGGATWKTLTLPLPIAAVETIQLQVSPLTAQTVFMSVWDRTSITCEPTNGTVGEGCERGYVSYDGGDSWQTQRLPVRGILDTGGGILAQGSVIYAQNVCNNESCVHLLSSGDGGRTWQVMDGNVTTDQRHLCDFTVTTSGQTVYAVTALTGCSQPPDGKSLWRSDDAGAHWRELGPLLPKPMNEIFYVVGNGTLLTTPGSTYSSLIYLNEPYTSNGGLSFYFSTDYGATWQSTPTLARQPDTAPDATQSNGTHLVQLSGIGQAVVLSDGSLFYVQDNPRGGRMGAYLWTPGATVWQRLPQLPSEVAAPESIIVTPGANGHDTITMTLHSSGDASNSIAYYVIRYQM